MKSLVNVFGIFSISFCQISYSTFASAAMKYIDIGANLKDDMYQGLYSSKNRKHEPDIENVLGRAWSTGLDKIIITGTNLEDCKSGLKVAQTDDRLYLTVGCHPTQVSELESDTEGYLRSLDDVIKEGGKKIVAYGEFGLDYDRLHFCPKETQLKFFRKQLDHSLQYELPLFLHSRNCEDDFLRLMEEYAPKLKRKGVVHSFTGTLENAKALIGLGFYIGINGCSLKTAENLEVVKSLPENKILIETDCPWCEVKPSHAGFPHVKTKFDAVKKEQWKPDKMIKGRNEPAKIVQVLEIIAALKGIDFKTLGNQIYENSIKLFFPGEVTSH